jgi:hypothetical protein
MEDNVPSLILLAEDVDKVYSGGNGLRANSGQSFEDSCSPIGGTRNHWLGSHFVHCCNMMHARYQRF